VLGKFAREEGEWGGVGWGESKTEERNLRVITTGYANSSTQTQGHVHTRTHTHTCVCVCVCMCVCVCVCECTDLTRAMFLLRGNKFWTVPFMTMRGVVLDITTDPRDAHLQVEC